VVTATVSGPSGLRISDEHREGADGWEQVRSMLRRAARRSRSVHSALGSAIRFLLEDPKMRPVAHSKNHTGRSVSSFLCITNEERLPDQGEVQDERVQARTLDTR
jgi:hypothetical protein